MKKKLGDKVIGWFLVDEDAATSEGTNESEDPAVKVVAAARPAIPVSQPHDESAFGAVYRAAEVADADCERLARVMGLLASLPADASADVKRAIVAASLEAFGVPIDRILVSGQEALTALDGHVSAGEQRTHDVVQQADARVAKLTAEIADVRRAAETQVSAQREVVRATTMERARVRAALDFFGGGGAGKAIRLVG